ncbi:hypothetical protein KKH46_02135 [Patescibacteria group bacterium]|nr:hypothetical protein [Patescibacteria group bacterium]
MKYGTVTLLRGEKTVVVDTARPLFDKRGRRISEGLQANVCDPNRDFYLKQPKLDSEADYANRVMRLHGCLDVNTTGITAFKAETERLLALVRGNSQIVNIVNGVHLPVIMPQLTTDDLGTALEQYLEVVGKSYAKDFPDRKSYNHRKGTLAKEVGIVDGSCHDQLIKLMKQGSVIGIYFPNSLQGYSIYADREQMSDLPEGFILSGVDIVIAMAMYPDILARDWYASGQDLAALSWRSVGSLGFRARDDELSFGGAGSLAYAYGGCSGGLLVLG